MEACQQMKYELIGQSKGFQILSYYVPKRPKVKKGEYFLFQGSSFKTNSNLKILFFFLIYCTTFRQIKPKNHLQIVKNGLNAPQTMKIATIQYFEQKRRGILFIFYLRN